MNLCHTLLTDEALRARPNDFELDLAADLLLAVRDIMEARVGYNGFADKKASAEKVISQTLAIYRDWMAFQPIVSTELVPQQIHVA